MCLCEDMTTGADLAMRQLILFTLTIEPLAIWSPGHDESLFIKLNWTELKPFQAQTVFLLFEVLIWAQVRQHYNPEKEVLQVRWDEHDFQLQYRHVNNLSLSRMGHLRRRGKDLDRTSRGPGFNSPTGPDFFTISKQCVFVSQCFIIKWHFIYLLLPH